MKKVYIVAALLLVTGLVYRSCSQEKENQALLEERSVLIQQQLKNVSKLIVTEGHFSEVFSYKDSQELFGSLITADKKALVVVNAEVTIAYDLSKLDVVLDPESTTVHIKNIPEPEIKINPDFEYYDVSVDYFNPFKASDYNTIKKKVNASLLKKIKASTLKRNAKNRLLSELSQMYILTRSMGWTLLYNDTVVQDNTIDTLLKD